VEKGDISSAVPGRFLFTFEGLIGVYPHVWSATEEKAALRLHQWRRAVSCWDIHEMMLAHIYDITWRSGYRLDVVTFRPDGFAEALERRFDREGIPVNGFVSYKSPDVLAQRLARMPDVMSVFFADPSFEFKFGGKGRMVRNAGVGFSPYI
jgi:hypothetical protein